MNRAIGVCPSEALMGFRVVSRGQLEPEGRMALDVTDIRERIVAHNVEYQAGQKVRFDKSRCRAKTFQEGDLVLVRITSR